MALTTAPTSLPVERGVETQTSCPSASLTGLALLATLEHAAYGSGSGSYNYLTYSLVAVFPLLAVPPHVASLIPGPSAWQAISRRGTTCCGWA